MADIRLLFSPYVRLVASIALPVLGFIGAGSKAWLWGVVLGCAFVIVVPDFSGGRWKGASTAEYGAVVGRALRLLSDLGNLTTGQFRLWVVDLYLPARPGFSCRGGREKRLRLSLRVTLTGAPAQVTEVAQDHPLIGASYSEGRSLLWWDEGLAHSTEENHWHRVGERINEGLVKNDYGVMSVHPVTNSVGAKRRGVLVVHARHDAEVATKVLGAVGEDGGKQMIAGACEDIFNLVGST